jgi:hypothetical protein
MAEPTRPKITFAEMRASGERRDLLHEAGDEDV